MDCKKPKCDVTDEPAEENSENTEEVSVEESVTNKTGSQEVRDGDWSCTGCQANNFARRQACFKCKASKDGVEDKFEFRSGDWSCSACGTHNFARRATCFQCRKQRPDGNDWVCRLCSTNNFARRAYCFDCNAPKYASETEGNRHGNNPYTRDNYNPRRDQGYDQGPEDYGRDSYHRGRDSYSSGRDSYNSHPRESYHRVDNYTDFNRGPPTRGGRNAVRDGDWYCKDCNFHNFARRDTCHECGGAKGEPEVAEKRGRSLPGDWLCDGCGENNFARRTKCFRCSAEKAEEAEVDE